MSFNDYRTMSEVRRITLSGFSGDGDWLANQTGVEGIFQIPDVVGRPATGMAISLLLVDTNGARVAPSTATFTYQLFAMVDSVGPTQVSTTHVVNVDAAAASQAFGSWLPITPRRGGQQKYAVRLTSFANVPVGATHAVLMVTGLG